MSQATFPFFILNFYNQKLKSTEHGKEYGGKDEEVRIVWRRNQRWQIFHDI
jgi:hypothetical protein